jgi:hypothetical protein
MLLEKGSGTSGVGVGVVGIRKILGLNHAITG